MMDIIYATRLVLGIRRYQISALVAFAGFFVLYLFILPARYTGGAVGLISLHFITPLVLVFAVLFSLPLALSLVFAVYAFKKKCRSGVSATATGAIGGGLLPILCCSPILPSIAAAFAGAIPAAFGISGFLQGFIATYEIQLYVLIVLFLLYTLYKNARQVMFAERGTCSV